MEHTYKNTLSVKRVAATVSKIADFTPPLEAEPAMGWVVESMKETLGGNADNVLIFSADAIAAWLVRRYPEKFAKVWRRAPMMIPMKTVMPTITPVDYAAFFSGANPSVNGVDHYLPPILSPELTQPLLKGDSLIAAAVRSGRHVCVITCSNGCIASMLSRSGADFRIIPGDDDEAMFREAQEVVKSGAYDFVFLYQLSFDYAQHGPDGPEGAPAMDALERIVDRFDRLWESAKKSWKGRSLVMFHTDHGCHYTEGQGGAHGDDIPEDTDIFHFWGGFRND